MARARRELMSAELLGKAAELFAERGFSGTPLQEVADALGISRPALYHYVLSKDALLEQLVEGSTQDTAAALAALRADDELEPPDKLRRAIVDMVGRIAENPARFVLLDRSERHLPEAVGEEHRQLKRAVLRDLTAIIAEGIERGAFRSVDEEVTAFAILGMCNWVAWWWRPSRKGGPEHVAEEYAELVLRGLLHRDAAEDTSVQATIARLREDLARLERLVEAEGLPTRL